MDGVTLTRLIKEKEKCLNAHSHVNRGLEPFKVNVRWVVY